MAHGGRPFWTREAEYLMNKFPTLYLDIAGVPPQLLGKYFPRFHRYADRVIFGSDYPSPGVPGSRTNAEEISKLPLPPDTLHRILHENATNIASNQRYFRI
ncbi:MAG: amidohydrolase family protein, partial [Candidatus Kariarchaeaceae archaeon]|jgi:predicted TIM-barrel fold metal-dependent hydrolase